MGKVRYTTRIGGATIEIKPLTLENSLRLFLLLAPHVARIKHYWPHLKKSVANGVVLELLLKDLANELQFMPGDIITAYSLLLDMPPEWIAVNATARELIESLPILDKVNKLGELWTACEALGVLDG